MAAWDLEVVRADGSDRRVLATGVRLRAREDLLGQPSNISWSPDSRRMAYAGDVGAGSAIFIVDRRAFGPTQIVVETLRAIDPAWSPDGSVIAFQSKVDTALHIVVPDGTGERPLTWLKGTDLWPEWSPDGSALVVAAWLNGNFDIYTVSAHGRTVTNVSNNLADEYSPSWSNDGRRLAWGRAVTKEPSNDSHAFVVVANADGTGQKVLPERRSRPADLVAGRHPPLRLRPGAERDVPVPHRPRSRRCCAGGPDPDRRELRQRQLATTPMKRSLLQCIACARSALRS